MLDKIKNYDEQIQAAGKLNNVADVSNLTRSQLLIWTGQKLSPKLPLYNMVMTYQIDGQLNPDVFQQAFQILLQKSDAMRTIFSEQDGIPQQKVLDYCAFDLDVIDFTESADPAASAVSWSQQRARQPVDISKSLFDSVLLKLSEEKWMWYYNQHHLMNDGWSVTLVFRRVSEYYQAVLADQIEGLQDLPQYCNYRSYEKENSNSPSFKKSIAFWKDRAVSNNGPLALYGKTPDVRSTAGKRIYAELNEEQSAALREIALEAGIRSFTLDLSLYYIFSTLLTAVLARISGEKHIAFGAPVHNRSSVDFKETIGLFIEMFPMKLDLESGETFRSLLKKVALETQDFLRHSGSGITTAELNNSFNVTLNFINASFGEFAGLKTRSTWVHPGDFDKGNSFSLLVHDFDATGKYQLHFDLNTDIFSAQDEHRIVDDFMTILKAFINDREIVIDDIKMLSDRQTVELLNAYNETARPVADGTIVDWFNNHAAAQPNAIAACCNEQSLSYSQLQNSTKQLANYFSEAGIKSGDMVAISQTRSFELLKSIWAITKIGAAFVPLDPSLPKVRKEYILQDSGSNWLVCNKGLAPAENADLRVIDPEESRDAISLCETTFPKRHISAQDLAYILYTSGSTGKPKGVRVSHGAIANYLNWAKRTYMPVSGMRMAVFTTISADLTLTSLLLPFISGGTAVVYPEEGSGTDLSIVRVAQDDAVDIVKLTPSHLALVKDKLLAATSINTLILGGEELKTANVRELAANGKIVYNEYGPTEATIGCMIYRYDPEEDGDSSVPIGSPIDNTQIYLLNEQLQPVPLGTPGELFIGGAGLADGYHKRFELTQERFVDNPFNKGTHLYRSGDLARFNNGQLQYLGRNDEQLKLGGFRIEPGEIETALGKIPAISNVVVDVVDVQPGSVDSRRSEKRLIAFFTADDKLEDSLMRSALAKEIPHYMIPAHLIQLDEMPLNATGKIDKLALPELVTLLQPHSSQHTPAQNQLQKELTDIWEGVLGTSPIGIEDNFLALGGGSLHAVSVIAQIILRYQITLPLQTLFETSTIKELSERIETAQQLETDELATGSATQIIARSTDASIPLSSAQRRIWYLQSIQPESYAYNMHQAVLLDAPLDVARLNAGVASLVNRHEILRTYFVEQKTELLQRIADSVDNVFIEVDLSAETSDKNSLVRRYAESQAQRTFALNKLPLWNLTYLHLPDNSCALVLIMHHIISDEWSVDVFWQHLAAFYQDNNMSATANLVQYADYSIYEQEWLQTSSCSSQLDYWKGMLETQLEPLQLTHRTASSNANRGAQKQLNIPKDILTKLKLLGGEESASLFMVLFAAYSILLQKLSGQSDFCIGTPVTLRERPELQNVIGFFLNTLPLRASVEENDSFREHLKKSRAICLESFANKDVPFDLLVKELRPNVAGGENPWFQSMLVVQNDGTSQLRFDDNSASAMQIDSGVSKFDFTLFMQEGEESAIAMVEYNTDMFVADFIEQLLQSWSTLLQEIVAQPDAQIQTINHYSKVQIDHLLALGCGPGVRIPAEPVHILIAKQAKANPTSIAVRYDKQTLSYGELNERATGLANGLEVNSSGVRIGILLERSVDYPVAILAVLKTGAAYVPLDPAYPADRLEMIIQDAGIKTVISSAEHGDKARGASIKIIDVQAKITNSAPVESAQQNLDSDAYIIYTSGSTGKPKGVPITHRNLLYSTFARPQFYENKPAAYLLLSSFAFDSSIAGIFWTLTEGGTLCLPDNDHYMEPDYLTTFIADNNISHILAIPSFYQQLIHFQPDRLLSLQTVIVAGEALHHSLIHEHQKLLPKTRLVNEYGPTEATVWATAADVTNLPESNRVPIGKPIGSTQLYVLDMNENLAVPGVPGELFIAGPQVAAGYVNRTKLTSERFIHDPFLKNGVMYRTGDRVCWRGDGQLDFLGRVDGQVKIRGHRIEPEEVEAVVAQLSEVVEVAVVPTQRTNASAIRTERLQLIEQQDWLTVAERFGSERLEKLISEIEGISSEQALQELPEIFRTENSTDDLEPAYRKRHRDADMAIELALLQEGFIRPPRDAQRNWMVGQWIAEATDDLRHLHELAKRFVSGETEHGEIYDEKVDVLADEEIMEDWQTPVMKAMAKQVTEAHGDVLEIGFGIGVSATFIQEQGVASHTIVEMNEYIANTLFKDWRAGYPKSDIRLVLGRWQDALEKLKTYDGVFFHAVPMDEEEFMNEMVGSITFAEHFFPVAAKLLKPGGVFTYMTTEVDSLSRRHQRALFKHFSSIALEIQPLTIPEDTKDWWWADSMVVVKATK
ncbi:MAG: amino acid adenylation domain-containing protein [Calditrichia bacterium]